MSTTTGLTIINGAISNLGSTYGTYLPVIIPVVLAVVAMYVILHWIYGAGKKR